MKPKSFFRELRERSGFIGIIALTNPLFITAYVLYFHKAGSALYFWVMGMVLTGVICLISVLFMGPVVFVERRRRMHEEARAAMWHDVMPYDPVKAKASRSLTG